MRSSKSRSRSKSNRNRSVGNIVNRVFDSSGPEGKVRGTPQQIIDKYLQLARDAQLGNDRVATENFQQHAEHYTRLLGEAQRDAEARREQQEGQQNRDGGQQMRQRDRSDDQRGQSRDDDQRGNGDYGPDLDFGADRSAQPQPGLAESAPAQAPVAAAAPAPRAEKAPEPAPQPEQPAAAEAPAAAQPTKEPAAEAMGVVDTGTESGEVSGLVETPEDAAPKPRRRRTTRKPKADAGEAGGEEAAEAPKPKRTRSKKAAADKDAPGADGPKEAAE
ncbi:DUF4167 domain-containing protein [Mangrovicoccus sp. HB161399]|uniref:DUF4167 domain-containing protein n=1 Tax=Mangrovicoccus sp. HB161399 TaxID=2720392 RepID=UPI001555A707|nr:DUF4167 domain-containing protein [Mangrovicoccus sp. HB161399]